jgi:hypothetical protein
MLPADPRTRYRNLWKGQKALLWIAAAIFFGSNLVFVIQGIKSGTGIGWWHSHVVESGRIPGGPAERLYHNGPWADLAHVVLLVTLDGGLIALWYRLLSRLRSM